MNLLHCIEWCRGVRSTIFWALAFALCSRTASTLLDGLDGTLSTLVGLVEIDPANPHHDLRHARADIG